MNSSRPGSELGEIVASLAGSYERTGGVNHAEGVNLPSKPSIISVLHDLQSLLFPGYYSQEQLTEASLTYFAGEKCAKVQKNLAPEICRALEHHCQDEKACIRGECRSRGQVVTRNLLQELPVIREALMKDVAAALAGDPAARSEAEVITCYPGLLAISVHRLAHFLHQEGVPLIPRILSEYIHGLTGIDIHPGAQIGEHFFIDHGTGVVIGETTRIGNRVKIYQGVTLGALSVHKSMADMKRHPTLEDDVTVYAGATILGGETVVGRGSIIGGNVWLTRSVPPFSRVTAGAEVAEISPMERTRS